jgi:hypothetical protein
VVNSKAILEIRLILSYHCGNFFKKYLIILPVFQIVIATYEARPVPDDHKIHNRDTVNHQVCWKDLLNYISIIWYVCKPIFCSNLLPLLSYLSNLHCSLQQVYLCLCFMRVFF